MSDALNSPLRISATAFARKWREGKAGQVIGWIRSLKNPNQAAAFCVYLGGELIDSERAELVAAVLRR